MPKRKISNIAKSVVENADRVGNYIERRDPALAIKALEMLAEGESFNSVNKKLGMKWETVARLKARHKMALNERRASLAEDALDIVEGLRLLQKEKMRMLAEDPEQLAKTNIRDLTLPWGIANDKFLSAMGENKVVVEHKTSAPSLEDAMNAIEEARAKMKLASIETIVSEIKE